MPFDAFYDVRNIHLEIPAKKFFLPHPAHCSVIYVFVFPAGSGIRPMGECLYYGRMCPANVIKAAVAFLSACPQDRLLFMPIGDFFYWFADCLHGESENIYKRAMAQHNVP